jgi:hypothetical protein
LVDAKCTRIRLTTVLTNQPYTGSNPVLTTKIYTQKVLLAFWISTEPGDNSRNPLRAISLGCRGSGATPHIFSKIVRWRNWQTQRHNVFRKRNVLKDLRYPNHKVIKEVVQTYRFESCTDYTALIALHRLRLLTT